MKRQVLIFSLALLAVLTYWSTLTLPAVMDDRGIIQQSVHEYGWQRSILAVSYDFDAKIGGGSGNAYHAQNIALHALDVVIVFLIVELFLPIGAAGAGAAVFAVHPFFTGAVNYVSGRSSMLAALFIWAALYFALTGDKHWYRYLIALGVLICGIFAKQESVLAIPLIVGFFVISGRVRLPKYSSGIFAALTLASAVTVPAMMDTVYSSAKIGTNSEALNQVGVSPTMTLIQHWQVVLNGFVFHLLGNLALPIRLTIDAPLSHGSKSMLIASIVALAGLALFVAVSQGNTILRLAAFSLMVAPTLLRLFVLLEDQIFEHRAYLFGLGLALIVGYGFTVVSEWRPIAAVATTCLLLIGLSIGTQRRNDVWRDPIKIWIEAHERAPGKLRPVLNLSQLYIVTGRSKEAIALLEPVVALHPEFKGGLSNLSSAYLVMGNYPAAESSARAALPLSDGYVNLAVAQQHMGQPAQSITSLERAIRENPMNKIARINIAMAYNALGFTRAAQYQQNLAMQLN